jgi:hypothetical protein
MPYQVAKVHVSSTERGRRRVKRWERLGSWEATGGASAHGVVVLHQTLTGLIILNTAQARLNIRQSSIIGRGISWRRAAAALSGCKVRKAMLGVQTSVTPQLLDQGAA